MHFVFSQTQLENCFRISPSLVWNEWTTVRCMWNEWNHGDSSTRVAVYLIHFVRLSWTKCERHRKRSLLLPITLAHDVRRIFYVTPNAERKMLRLVRRRSNFFVVKFRSDSNIFVYYPTAFCIFITAQCVRECDWRRTKQIEEEKNGKEKRDEKSAEFWTCAKETSVVVCRLFVPVSWAIVAHI